MRDRAKNSKRGYPQNTTQASDEFSPLRAAAFLSEISKYVGKRETTAEAYSAITSFDVEEFLSRASVQ
jgi:hypothetical protein